MAGIYLHIPFCKKMCGYCDFFKSVHTSRISEVVDAMLCEIESQRDFLHDKVIRTIYFGGGTPSLLTIQQVEKLLDKCHENFDTSQLSEITLEANPDDLNEEYLTNLFKIGVNRLSIGVQSFNKNILKFMNRRHTSQQAKEAVEMARRAGFDNITIDLIFGIGNYPTSTLEESIDEALKLDVEHISAYHLTIESGTEFARRLSRQEITLASEEQSEREYLLLHEKLTQAGYEHYEISSYALKGRRSQHNTSYWQSVEYLGVGAGAHSYNGEYRRICCPSIDKYLNGGDQRYEVEQLSLQEQYNEYVMTSLRWCEGADIKLIRERFGEKYASYINIGVKPWVESGEILRSGEKIKIDAKKYMLSDMIIESLLIV